MLVRNYISPKLGKIFKVIGVARISTDNQDELSLEDQEAYLREWLDRTYGKGNYVLEMIAYRGSGQILDHEDFLRLCSMVESGEYDLVVAEDLSRIVRSILAVLFCETAEAVGTRVVGIGDPVDTANEGWEYSAVFASLKNKAFCKDTARRIRRTLRNRFENGGIVMCLQFGYIKPSAKASDDEVRKDPDAEVVYEKWISMLENGASYAEVARRLNAGNVPTGQYCRAKKWSGPMVKRLTYNPILKGERHRNKKVVTRDKNGHPVSVEAPPEELLIRKVPHLAFVEPYRWHRLIRQLDQRNEKYQRSKDRKNDPRADIPKRQTRWPGQHLRCGVCGRLYVHGGHGRKGRMMCNGAREYACWNAMTVDAFEVANVVASDVRELVRSLPAFDEKWAAEYESRRGSVRASLDAELDKNTNVLSKKKRELENLLNGLAELGSSPSVVGKIRSCESEIQLLEDRSFKLEQSANKRVALPSLDEIIAVADKSFVDLAVSCEKFGRMMKSFVTEFYALPYQLADGGHIQPRIVFQANLAALVEQSESDMLRFDQIVDLAKKPRRLLFLKEVVRMVGAGEKHADIGEQLGLSKTEVGHTMRLHRSMKKLGVGTPWVPVTKLEQVFNHYKRVRNSQFAFEPLTGFEVTRHPKAD